MPDAIILGLYQLVLLWSEGSRRRSDAERERIAAQLVLQRDSRLSPALIRCNPAAECGLDAQRAARDHAQPVCNRLIGSACGGQAAPFLIRTPKLVLCTIQRIHRTLGSAILGHCLGIGRWRKGYVWFSTLRSASSWRRSWPTATGRASTSSERASCSPRRIEGRRSRWPKASASVGRPCGGGNNVLPRPELKVCCVTRPASPARRRSRRKPPRGWWR